MRLFSTESRFWGVWLPLSIGVVASVAIQSCWAQAPNVTRIEEDWELVVGVPSPTSDAPQVTTIISPVGNLDSLYAMFMINHHDEPELSEGGLELQVWNDKTLLNSDRYPDRFVMVTSGETVRWTQSLEIGSEGLVFQILDGSSTTWGKFGGEGTLKITVPTTLANLNGFNPAVSAEHSDVGYAANRVQALVLKRVRAYAGDELVAEDNNPRVIHSLDQ
jgi:hypothetical protein